MMMPALKLTFIAAVLACSAPSSAAFLTPGQMLVHGRGRLGLGASAWGRGSSGPAGVGEMQQRSHGTSSLRTRQAARAPSMVLALPGMKRASVGQIVIEEVAPNDIETIKETAEFFVDAFWKDYKAEAEMSVEQKRRISNEQYDDMRLRYGTKSPVLSSLIIAKDEEGTIVGCVGLEQAIFLGEKVLPKSRENLARNYNLTPLLANLAVSPKARGMGLARRLCLKVEEVTRSWGEPELWLLVEDANTPALKLYKGLGFNRLWEDNNAKASMVVPYGGGTAIRTIKVTNVAMSKDLTKKGGLFGLGLGVF